MNAKKWYASKTIWTNVAALAAVGAQAAVGNSVMDPALQAALLAVTNTALRLFTSERVA
ncbi:hypothetical protein [Fundidesulfovibrio soli]|uniref:hypothetical protein n=1 Tax=Fundidesulfovibrio soli TaxID=2922716 RepID=UPI001FAEF61C|nr:hypothetical protein [Fundidesulfovibrio soli]